MELNFDVNVIEFVKVNNEKVSSTYIRKLIEDSNLKEVELELGKKYEVTGKVIHGKKLGRKIGLGN